MSYTVRVFFKCNHLMLMLHCGCADGDDDDDGAQVGDEIVRVNGFTIAEAIHDDVLNLIKSRDEIVLKVTRKSLYM